MVAQVREAKTSEEKVLFDRLVEANVCKSLYKSNAPWFISKELSQKLSFRRQIISDLSKYAWEIPITQLVPRSYYYQYYGDTWLYKVGGFSFGIKWLCYVHYSEDIQYKSLKYFTSKSKDYSTGEFISINLLEYTPIILTYAVSTFVLFTLPPSP